MTTTPDAFACGVDIVGPSNLNTLPATIPPYWEAGKQQMYRRTGDPTTDAGKALLKERSPLTYADKIEEAAADRPGRQRPARQRRRERPCRGDEGEGHPRDRWWCSRTRGMASRGRRTTSPSTRSRRISSPDASAAGRSRSAMRCRARPRR
ncbi:hypothetical protein AB5I41_20550 [Sphingomonas sp. MMS24-JH45]